MGAGCDCRRLRVEDVCTARTAQSGHSHQRQHWLDLGFLEQLPDDLWPPHGEGAEAAAHP